MKIYQPDFGRNVVAILRRLSVLHAKTSSEWNTGKPHAYPERKATAGHSFSRPGHSIISRRLDWWGQLVFAGVYRPWVNHLSVSSENTHLGSPAQSGY